MTEQYFYHPKSDNIVIGHAAFIAHEIERTEEQKQESLKLGITYSMDIELYKQVGWFIETPHGIAFMNADFISNNMINLDSKGELE